MEELRRLYLCLKNGMKIISFKTMPNSVENIDYWIFCSFYDWFSEDQKILGLAYKCLRADSIIERFKHTEVALKHILKMYNISYI